MRVQCAAQASSEGPEFYSRKQMESLMGLEFSEDICPAISGNTARRYGPEVASFLSSVQTNILSEKEEDVIQVNEDAFVIRNHKSGTPLSTITLRAVDDFGQGPAVGVGSREVFAVMSSPDGLFDGSVGVPLNLDLVHLTATGFATPGTYKVVVEFDQEQINSMEITVEVKSCDMGEVPSGNGTFCEPCTTSTFSFHPDDDLACHPCPENGNCETRVILPKKGYWHKTPCSEHIQRCLASDGCDFEDRQQDMIEATKDVESCDFDEESLENYAEAQCREVSLDVISASQTSCTTGTRWTSLRFVQGVLRKDALLPLREVLLGIRQLRSDLRLLSCTDGTVKLHSQKQSNSCRCCCIALAARRIRFSASSRICKYAFGSGQ